MKKVITIFLTLIVLSLVIFPLDAISEKAPAFTITTTDGFERSLYDYSGKVLVLIIMFTSCSVCNRQMPVWVEEYEERDDDVEFLSVSVDNDDTNVMLDEFQDKYGATWPIASDASFIEKYDASMVPRTIMISPNGDLASTHAGYMESGDINKGIDEARSYEESISVDLCFLSISILSISVLLMIGLIKRKSNV